MAITKSVTSTASTVAAPEKNYDYTVENIGGSDVYYRMVIDATVYSGLAASALEGLSAGIIKAGETIIFPGEKQLVQVVCVNGETSNLRLSSGAKPKAAIGKIPLVLHASGAEVATGNDSAVALDSNVNGAIFDCDLTVVALAAGDTFDLFVQTRIDGALWIDVVHFTQMLGNGGVLRFIAKIAGNEPEADFEIGAALGASAVRQLLGNEFRARWVIAGPTPSFTFTLNMITM